MSKDIHKWSDGRYTLMFDEHTFFVYDNEKEERMTALNVTKKLNELSEENEQLKKQIQIYEQLISNSYVGEEETLDGFVGKYVIWEDELQKYREKIKKVIDV